MDQQETMRKVGLSNKGKVPWNKGLTKELDPRIKGPSKGFVPWSKGKTKEEFPQLSHIAWDKGHTKEEFPQMSNSGRKKGCTPWNKGKKGFLKHNQTARNSIGTASRKRWQDPEYREMMIAMRNTETYRQRARSIAKELWKDPQYIQIHSEKMLEKWQDPEFMGGMRKKHHTDKTKDLLREMALIQWGDPENRVKQSQRLLQWFRNHPEKNPAHFFRGRSSKVQNRMFEIVKANIAFGLNVFLNYKVKTSKTYRFIDVAIPSVKLGFEFDGKHWHPDISKDKARDAELSEQGWVIVHINENGLRYISNEVIS